MTNPYGIPVGGGVLGAPAAGGGGGSGTVTSIDMTAPATIFSVGGGPVTTSGTLVLSVTGTSGGVPYFSASNKMGTSGALTASALVLGGGAGAAPTPMASLGTATTVLHGNAAGAPTFGAVSLSADVTGTLPVANGGTGLTAGTSGGIPYYSGSTTIASSALLTASAIILGGGAGAAPTALGSLGTTTTVLHGNAAGAPTFGAVSLTADVTGTLPVANGGTGGTALSAVFVGRKGAATLQLVGNAAILVAGTFWFTLKAPVGFTINSLRAQCAVGSFTANVKIGSTSVTGLSAVSVTTTPTTTNATAANTVVVDDVISVVVTSPASSPTDAVLTLTFTYT